MGVTQYHRQETDATVSVGETVSIRERTFPILVDKVGCNWFSSSIHPSRQTIPQQFKAHTAELASLTENHANGDLRRFGRLVGNVVELLKQSLRWGLQVIYAAKIAGISWFRRLYAWR
jgi:hypothetical protein